MTFEVGDYLKLKDDVMYETAPLGKDHYLGLRYVVEKKSGETLTCVKVVESSVGYNIGNIVYLGNSYLELATKLSLEDFI